MAKKRERKRHVQLSLDAARKPIGHGGWRPGAGRPRTRKGVSHDRRELVAPQLPQLVTFKIATNVTSLRHRKLCAIIRRAIASSHKRDFRIAEFNVESNHLHFIIEAKGNGARARGIQGLTGRIAKRVNRAVGRRGALFADRYHTRALRTPREVRNALRYVLNNARHHGVVAAGDRTWIDPCSSAAWFTGWRERIQPDTWWKRELLAEPSPVAAPTVWLLAVGWRRHGAIAFDEAPAS